MTVSDRIPRGRLIAFVLAALLVVVLVWLVFVSGDDSDSATPAMASDDPVLVSPAELSEAAAELDHPIYWVGTRDGTSYELTQTKSGRVFVRYLDEGVEAGDPRRDFLIISTYPVEDGEASLRRAAKQSPEAKLTRSRDGALTLIDTSSGSVHMAYPNSDQQIEVYSPDVEEALRAVIEGQVQPVP